MTAMVHTRLHPWRCCAVACLTALVIGVNFGSVCLAQDGKKNNAKKQVTPETFTDLRALKPIAGKWKMTIRVWSGESGEPAVESNGTAEFTSVLGGRFFRESNRGKIGDKEYEGVGYWGYNEAKKKFTRVWMDSLGTATVKSEGNIDQARKMISLYGRVDNSTGDQADKMMRWELDLSNSKKMILKMFDLSIHKDAKVFEIVYEKIEDK